MSKLSTRMSAVFLASTIAATSALADDDFCPSKKDPSIFDKSVATCLAEEADKLSHVEGQNENYRVEGAHEISVYSKHGSGHMGTIDVHWDTLQPEVSEADIPFSGLTVKAQDNFKAAVKEACEGITDNLNVGTQRILDRAEEHYGDKPNSDVSDAKNKISSLKHFTNEYCPNF